MPKENILVVEDEEDILELVIYNLSREGYHVIGVMSGEEVLKKTKAKTLDLIVLDLMLPGIDGLEVTKILKNDSKTQNIPIVMLTAKGDEADIVTGLELGADDYITKPFSTEELLLRIEAVLKRTKPKLVSTDKEPVKIGSLIFDYSNQKLITRKGERKLTKKESEMIFLKSFSFPAISRISMMYSLMFSFPV